MSPTIMPSVNGTGVRHGYDVNGLERLTPYSDLPQIDDLLRDFLERSGHRFAFGPRLKPLFEHVAAFALQGGKRVRPRLCLASYRILTRRFDAVPANVWACAAVLELLHAFMLAHDDLIDGSVKRREQATLHERIRLDAEIGGDAKKAANLGLISGDLLFALAIRLLSLSGLNGQALTRSLRLFSGMLVETGMGEALDVLHDDCSLETISEQQINDAYLRKTARYSVSGPLVLGATIAGAPAKTRKALNRFGNLLGFGYQIRNDLEALSRGLEEEDHPDLDSGKRTWAIWRAYRNLPESGRRELLQSLALSPGLAKRRQLMALMRDSGALEDCREMLGRTRADAAETLRRSALDADQRRDFLNLPQLFSDIPLTS